LRGFHPLNTIPAAFGRRTAIRSEIPFALLLLSLSLVTLAAEEEAAAAKPPLAIVGARILPVSSAPIEDGLILVAEGKILYVGPRDEGRVGRGTRTIDATGLVVCPGFVDARAGYALAAGEMARPPAGPDVRAADGLDPFAEGLDHVLAAGVTTVFVPPPYGTGVNGRGVAVKVRPGVPVPEATIDGDPVVKASLGPGPNPDAGPIARMFQAAPIDGALRSGDAYVKAREDYTKAKEAYEKALAEYRKRVKEAEKKKGEKETKAPKDGGKPPEKKAPEAPKEPEPPVPPKESAAGETMGDIVTRRGLLTVEARDAVAALAALDLREGRELRLVLEVGADAARVRREIADAAVPVVVAPVLGEESGKRARIAAELAADGVPVAIATASAPGPGSRLLVLHAARAVAAGLDPDAALAAITLRAAEVSGVAARVGSLEAGKDADLVFLTGPPLDTRSRVVRVLVDGETVFERKP
jgi:imidazolonepropionase-like amidohydrolase